MKIYGLLGHNISYSLSPAMQNAAFEKVKLKAEYKIFDIEPERVDDFLNSLLRSNINGLNVTVPYKIKAYEFIKTYGTIDKDAEKLGAINTIVIKNKSIFGYNTDATGFIRSLESNLKFYPEMKNVFIFGAGGAGTACAIKLAEVAEKIFISDTDQEKIKVFSERFFNYYGKEKLSVIEGKDKELKDALQQCSLLVNATPFGRNKDEMLVKPEFLHEELYIFDLIYKPSETPIIKAAKKIGIKAVNGVGMLLYQGSEAFQLWTGKRAPIRVMKSALTKELAEN